MDQSARISGRGGATGWLRSPRTNLGAWRAIVIAAALITLGLIACVPLAYIFQWEWTGFPGNTYWNWLQLLLVPAALGAGVLWYTRSDPATSMAGVWTDLRHGRIPLVLRTLWRGELGVEGLLLCIGAALVFICALLAAVGVALIPFAYLLDWQWTGYQGKALWDWLSTFLLPTAVTAATVRLNAHQQAQRGT